MWLKYSKVLPLSGEDFSKPSYEDFSQSLYDISSSRIDYGASCDENLKIYGFKIGALNGSKPIIMIQGNIHGSEWESAIWLKQFTKCLFSPPSTHTLIFDDLLNTFDFVIISSLNPTGYVDNTYQNRNGVNLNRNYSELWDSYDDGGDPMQYKGTSAFSEVETQISRDVYNEYKPVLFLDCHTWSGSSNNSFWVGKYNYYRHRKWYEDLEKVMRFHFGSKVEKRKNLVSPMAAVWGTGKISQQYTECLSMTLEVGSSQTNLEKSTYGLNLLLYSCMMANPYEWHSKFKRQN